MDAHTLLLFLLTQVAMAMSPGPAVLMVMSEAARGSWRAGALAGAGIVTGTALWFGLSALGLTAVLLASPLAFEVLKWGGAAFLVVIGVRLLFASGGAADAAPAAGAPGRRRFLQGVMTQLANPKAMIFIGALLPQFLDPTREPLPQFALLGAITVFNEYLVLLGYAWLADRGARLAGGSQLLRWFDRLAGGLLVGAGAKLAVLARA
jgi:homoserine/homoserine lactone efflux protein